MMDQRIHRALNSACRTDSLKEVLQTMSKPFQVEDILKVLEFAEKYGSPNLKNFEMFKAFKVDVFNLCDQHTPDHINCPACGSVLNLR